MEVARLLNIVVQMRELASRRVVAKRAEFFLPVFAGKSNREARGTEGPRKVCRDKSWVEKFRENRATFAQFAQFIMVN